MRDEPNARLRCRNVRSSDTNISCGVLKCLGTSSSCCSLEQRQDLWSSGDRWALSGVPEALVQVSFPGRKPWLVKSWSAAHRSRVDRQSRDCFRYDRPWNENSRLLRKRCWFILTAERWPWKSESAKECVITHRPNEPALKMDGAQACYPYLAARVEITPWRVGRRGGL
jgi:hypothetical protein